MSTKDITDRQVCEAYARRAQFVADRTAQRGEMPWPQSAIADSDNPGRYPDEILAEMTGQPLKVCYRAMERAEGRGLIDCGTSTRHGWLTDKGKALLDSAIAKEPPNPVS